MKIFQVTPPVTRNHIQNHIQKYALTSGIDFFFLIHIDTHDVFTQNNIQNHIQKYAPTSYSLYIYFSSILIHCRPTHDVGYLPKIVFKIIFKIIFK